MSKGGKKKEINSLKKRLLSLEQKYGFQYNGDFTQQPNVDSGSQIYKKSEDYEESHTDSHPKRGDTGEIESLRNVVDTKISEVRSEFKEESSYTTGRFDAINERLRVEGIDLRSNMLTRNFFYWFIGLLLPILGTIIFFLFNNLDGNIKEIRQDLKHNGGTEKELHIKETIPAESLEVISDSSTIVD